MNDTYIFDDKALAKRLQSNTQSAVSWQFMYGEFFANLYCVLNSQLYPKSNADTAPIIATFDSYHINITLHQLSLSSFQYKKVFDTYIEVNTHKIPYIKDLILQVLSKFGEIALSTCKKNIINLILHNLWIDSEGRNWQIGELNGITNYYIHYAYRDGTTINHATINMGLRIPLHGLINIGSLFTLSYSRKDLKKYIVYTLVTFFNANPEYLIHLEHKHLSWIVMKGL